LLQVTGFLIRNLAIPCPKKRYRSANVGRFDKSDPATKVSLGSTIMLNPDELEAARELCEQGIPVYHQLIPSDIKTPLKSLIERANK
jgi:fructoselysine and glucoselysine-specific PTS system IIB component